MIPLSLRSQSASVRDLGWKRSVRHDRDFVCHFSCMSLPMEQRLLLGVYGHSRLCDLIDSEVSRDSVAWKTRMGSDLTEAGRWLKGIRLSERLRPEVSIHLCDCEGNSIGPFPSSCRTAVDLSFVCLRTGH